MDGIYGRSDEVQSNFEQATSRNNPIASSRASKNISCPSTSYFLVGVRAFTVSLSNKWLTFCTAAQACPRRWSQTKERELEVHRGISAKTHQNAWIVTQAVERRPTRGLSRVYKARRSTPTCRHSSSVPCNTSIMLSLTYIICVNINWALVSCMATYKMTGVKINLKSLQDLFKVKSISYI